MSEDPCIYNDNIKLSGPNAPRRMWNLIPSILQLDIFDQLEWHHKRSFGRVCRLWKHLLERQPPVLWLDICTALSYFRTQTGRTRKNRFARFLGNVGAYFMPVTFFEPRKRFAPSPELCRALGHSRVLVVHIPTDDEPGSTNELLLMDLYDDLNVVELIRRSNTIIHHVVMFFGGFPIDPLIYEYWINEIAALSIVLQRPITYSVASCALYLSQHICEIWNGVYCQLTPDTSKGMVPVPAVSFNTPPNRTAVFRRIELGLKKTILPYSDKQLVWLQQCRRLLEGTDDCNFALILDGWCISEHSLTQIVATFIAGNCSGDQSKSSSDPRLQFGTLECEQLAVMISLFARMISTGKFALPPPPEHVPLCFAHPNTVVCACVSLVTAADPYKLLRAHVISSARRYSIKDTPS